MDPEYLLEQTEIEIARAKAEVLSRKEILDKVEKWLAACQEEFWLDDYNKVNILFISYILWSICDPIIQQQFLYCTVVMIVSVHSYQSKQINITFPSSLWLSLLPYLFGSKELVEWE